MKNTVLVVVGSVGAMLAAVACSGESTPTSPAPAVEATGGSSVTGEGHQAVTTASARMHPENRSAVKGRIDFEDDGQELRIDGAAAGLDPNTTYISLIYDNESVPGSPEGCEPGIFDPTDPDFLLPTMFVGVWSVDAAGDGTLSETNVVDGATGQRVRVPLSKFRTVSIRDTSVNGGFGPEAVVACGRVATHGAG